MSVVKTSLYSHILGLGVGSVLGALFIFLTQLLIIRHLSVYDFGLWSVSIITINILSTFIGFGLPGYILKFSAKYGLSYFKWPKGSKAYVLYSTIGIFLLLILVFALNDSKVGNIILILTPVIVCQIIIDLVNSKLQIEKKYTQLPIWQFFPQMLRFASIFLLLLFYRNIDISDIAYTYVFATIIIFFIGLILLRDATNNKSEQMFSDASLFSLIGNVKRTWAFGLSGFLYFIYFQSDILILEYIEGEESAAIYSVAFLVMSSIYLIPSVIFQKYLLPIIHCLAYKDNFLLKRYYHKNLLIMLIVGITITTILWVLVPYLSPLLFGAKYQNVIFLIMLLLFTVPVRFISINAGVFLMTKNNIINKVKYMSVVALFNVVFNFIFIPIYGILGAAIVTIISEIMLMLMYLYSVNKYIFDN